MAKIDTLFMTKTAIYDQNPTLQGGTYPYSPYKGVPPGNLACNHGAIIDYKDLYGINKVLLLLNEHGNPLCLFPNFSSYNKNNQ